MPTRIISADFGPLHQLADRHALRLCNRARISADEREDVCHDLLLDLLARMRHYDPGRSTLVGFATVCFQHRACRLEARFRRERHTVSLDTPLAGAEGLTLADTLASDHGYAAWLGQPADDVAELECRLDMDRALGTLPESALPICAALMRDGSSATNATGLSRSTLHRRVKDLRLRLLAAGVGTAAGTERRVAG